MIGLLRLTTCVCRPPQRNVETQLQCKEDELRTAHADIALRVDEAVLAAEAQSRQVRTVRMFYSAPLSKRPPCPRDAHASAPPGIHGPPPAPPQQRIAEFQGTLARTRRERDEFEGRLDKALQREHAQKQRTEQLAGQIRILQAGLPTAVPGSDFQAVAAAMDQLKRGIVRSSAHARGGGSPHLLFLPACVFVPTVLITLSS